MSWFMELLFRKDHPSLHSMRPKDIERRHEQGLRSSIQMLKQEFADLETNFAARLAEEATGLNNLGLPLPVQQGQLVTVCKICKR